MIDRQKLEEDIEKVINNQFNDFNFQRFHGITSLMNQTLASKARFYRNFSNEDNPLIDYISKEKMSFCLSDKEKENRFEKFICPYESAWNSSIDNEFAKYLRYQKDGFFNNEVMYDYIYNEKKITKGMKLSKSFKYFFSDLDLLRSIQDKYSEYIQQEKITGQLCISVHPLDFLSSSENTHGWRSCHSLNGEFRAGNLSYMCDSSTLICYLRSDEETKLPRFPDDVPWNNKKWRMLIHISEDKGMIFFGRQYPMEIEGIHEIIFNYLKKQDILVDLLSQDWKYSNDYVQSVITTNNIQQDVVIDGEYKFLLLGESLISKSELITEPKSSLHYNDILYSSCYTKPYYSILIHRTLNVPWCKPEFFIGANVICPVCGKNILESSESLICWECEEKVQQNKNEEQTYLNVDPEEQISLTIDADRFEILSNIIDNTLAISSDGSWDDELPF